jgi:Fuc2NAc and GlcNAc transferase
MPTLVLTTALLSLVAVNWVRRYLKQQFIDIPNERSSHQRPTPRGGGLGFVMAIAIGLLLYYVCLPPIAGTIPLVLWLSLLPLIAISLLDDWKSMRAIVRYLVQLLVSALIVWQTGPFPLPWLQSLTGWSSLIAVLLTIIGITALINFYNFMDGLDGLVAGVSVVQIGFCAIVLHQPILWLVVAALLGFLAWNWSPARIFMGDAGSTVLGAIMAISLLLPPESSVSAWTNLAILLPLVADAVYTLCCRAIRRENIFQAHRTHLYQRLNQAGWSHAQVAVLYIVATYSVVANLMLFGGDGAVLSLFGTMIAVLLVEKHLRSAAKPAELLARLPNLKLPVLANRVMDSDRSRL